MKNFGIFILTLLVIAVIGGFGYFAFTDLDIQQREVEKVLPNEQFFDS